MNSRKLGKIRKYGKKPQGKYSLIDSVLKAGYRLKGGFYDKGRRGQVPVPALLRIRKPTIVPWNCLTTQ